MSHYFPEEIWIQILTTLPVKPLIRFTLVSKSWYELISSPTFITMHMHHTLKNRNQEDKSVIVSGLSDKTLNGSGYHKRHFYKLILDILKHSQLSTSNIVFPRKGNYSIVGSSTGLLCLVSYFGDEVLEFVLCNPSIEKSIKLPSTQMRLGSSRMSLHPPLVYGHKLGFGVDFVSGNPKVVRIVVASNRHRHVESSFIFEADVYSLKTNSWNKLVEPNIKRGIYIKSERAVTFCGCPHWLAYRMQGNDVKNSILTFDTSLQVFKEIMMPDGLGKKSRLTLCPNLFQETLILVEYYKNPTSKWESCKIWAMKKYQVFESWETIHTFDLNGVIGSSGQLVGLAQDESKVLATGGGNVLVLFDIKTRKIKKFCFSGGSYALNINGYVESLILLQR